MGTRELPPPEIDGPYINAPDWPWWTAGWVLAALFVLLVILAYGGA